MFLNTTYYIHQSPVARLIAIIWMMISVIFVCTVTGSITTDIMSANEFEMEGNTVAVLRNSHEAAFANKYFLTYFIP